MKRLMLLFALLIGLSASAQEYILHTVKWYEDLTDIANRYGVSEKVIMAFNGLETDVLEKRSQIKIPVGDFSEEEILAAAKNGAYSSQKSKVNKEQEAEKVSKEQEADKVGKGNSKNNNKPGKGATVEVEDNSTIETTVAPVAPAEQEEESTIVPEPVWQESVSAALLLPFNAAAENPSTIAFDFYSGALLAANHLAQQGINLNLNVHDVYGDVLPEELEKVDFVVGPLSTRGLSSTLAMVDSLTAVISPLDSKTLSLAGGYPNFIQNTASQFSQYEDLVTWVGEDYAPSDTVLVFYENGVAGLNLKEEVLGLLEDVSYPWTPFTYNILEGREVTEVLMETMAVENMNRVIIASENEAFVNDVIRNLNLLIHNNFQITIYASSKVRSFDTIEIEHFHNSHLHCSLSFYTDYDDARVREFLMQYRALYCAEPSQTAYHGYDTIMYFAQLVHKYGPEWLGMLTQESQSMLMSDFSFEKLTGYNRNGVRRIVYNTDYSIKYLHD